MNSHNFKSYSTLLLTFHNLTDPEKIQKVVDFVTTLNTTDEDFHVRKFSARNLKLASGARVSEIYGNIPKHGITLPEKVEETVKSSPEKEETAREPKKESEKYKVEEIVDVSESESEDEEPEETPTDARKDYSKESMVAGDPRRRTLIHQSNNAITSKMMEWIDGGIQLSREGVIYKSHVVIDDIIYYTESNIDSKKLLVGKDSGLKYFWVLEMLD